jgi:hypothetical protein
VGTGAVAVKKSATSRAVDIEKALQQEFRTLSAANADLPMLTEWGVESFSERIHSLGINYLAQIGRRAGYIAVSEYPVRVARSPESVLSPPSWVIPDVVWWDRTTRRVPLIGEFERYEPGGNKHQLLKEKVRSLLWAHRELGNEPRVLLLLLWTMSGNAVQKVEDIRSLMRTGFRSPGGAGINGLEPESRFAIATAVFTSFKGCMRLKEILL